MITTKTNTQKKTTEVAKENDVIISKQFITSLNSEENKQPTEEPSVANNAWFFFF